MQIYIGMVSKVHKNAFTDIEDEAPSINYYNCSYDQHMTIEQVQTQDPEILKKAGLKARIIPKIRLWQMRKHSLQDILLCDLCRKVF